MFSVDLPYDGIYRLSGGREYTSFEATIVRLTNDTGLTGWGESTPFGGNYIAAHAAGEQAAISELAPSLLGTDPRSVDRINAKMGALLTGHGSAKAAIDIACWDLFARSVDLPVCELLGGSTRAPLLRISSIGGGSPDDMRGRVAEHRRNGYVGHSVKIGATEAEGGPALDAERVAACLADRQPGEYFIVDANGGMVPETALRFLRLLPANADIVFEAPCSTLRETLAVRRRSSVPIVNDELATDDASILEAITQDACDGIGLKITKAGGLSAARRHRDLCTTAGLTMSVQDTWGSEISFAAIAHLAQTVPPHLLRCVLDTRDCSPLVVADIDVPDVGTGVGAPTGPGLGVSPREDVLGQPIASWS